MIQGSFEYGFPQKIRNEYEHVITLIGKDNNGSFRVEHGYNSKNEVYILFGGTQINIER